MLGKLDDYMRFNESALNLREKRQTVLLEQLLGDFSVIHLGHFLPGPGLGLQAFLAVHAHRHDR